MAAPEPTSVVLDTSVLINFLAVDRMDVFARHPGYRFLVTDHVRGEVTAHYREQVERLNAALVSGSITVTRVEAIEELTLFARLTGNPRLGTGECAAMAAAVHRNHVLAIDDKTARNTALSVQPTLAILDTQALMVSFIRLNILSVQEADAIKDEWANKHSFVLKVNSFQELL